MGSIDLKVMPVIVAIEIDVEFTSMLVLFAVTSGAKVVIIPVSVGEGLRVDIVTLLIVEIKLVIVALGKELKVVSSSGFVVVSRGLGVLKTRCVVCTDVEPTISLFSGSLCFTIEICFNIFFVFYHIFFSDTLTFSFLF